MSKPKAEVEWADEKIVTARWGITHTPLYNLRKSGVIRSVSLKMPGQKYGKRLYHVGSILAFLASLEAQQTNSSPPADPTMGSKESGNL